MPDESTLKTEKDALTVRVTSTGVVVIEGPCPHCSHDAMEHWSSGCKGGRGDHCRMDPTKLARLALCLNESGCDGHSHSLLCNNAYFAAIRPPVTSPPARCMDCGHQGPTSDGDCDRCAGPAMPRYSPGSNPAGDA